MNVKLRNTTIAIVLAVVSTLILTSYLNTLRAEISDGSEIVKVFVATSPISAGTTNAELLLKIEKQDIPKKFVAADAILEEADMKDQTLVVSLSQGEQLTKNKFRKDSVSDVSYLLPQDKVAISIPVDEVIGVAGNIKSGDKVTILATLSPGPGGKDMTKVLLSGIEVLQSSGTEAKKGKISSSGGVKKTLTIAATAAEAEKIVFAKEKGTIWVALQPSESPGQQGPTGGQNVDTVFK